MKVYSIDTDSDNLIGDGDQQVFSRMNTDQRESFVNEYPQISVPLPFLFNDGAKVTDVLSQGGIISNGFLINSKVKKIFESFKLMEHKYYPALVLRNGQLEEYYWIQLLEDLSEEIDFQQTVFREVRVATIVGEIKLRSLAHYQELRAEKGWRFTVNSKEIVIKSDSKLKQMDMFYFGPFDYATCISECLKNAIEEHGITGFEIKEYNDVKFDI